MSATVNHKCAEDITPAMRMRATLTGKVTDRVPFFPTNYIDHACVVCGHQFEEVLVNPLLGPE